MLSVHVETPREDTTFLANEILKQQQQQQEFKDKHKCRMVMTLPVSLNPRLIHIHVYVGDCGCTTEDQAAKKETIKTDIYMHQNPRFSILIVEVGSKLYY